MRSFEPLNQLISRESVRFIGTVSDLVKDSLRLYIALTEAFSSSETKPGSELVDLIITKSGGCSAAVARNTLEVAAGLRIIVSISQGSSANRKFSLGESGRVIRAVINRSDWDPKNVPTLFMRPMFESHGDYLLQALTAARETQSREDELSKFTLLVRDLAEAKLNELPPDPSGLAWDTYVTELRQRKSMMSAEADPPSKNEKVTLTSLQTAHRQRFAQLTKKVTTRERPQNASTSKTFQHQLARCRSWLEDLRLIHRAPGGTQITKEGVRILSYFEKHSPAAGPTRIPPTAALLKDAFRLSDELIEQSWGTVVDDEFWEQGLYDLSRNGTYEPTEGELIDAVNTAFDWVRIRQVSEAAISPLRQAVFLSFFLSGRPLQPTRLTIALQKLLEDRGDLFGLGRNRQGRPAFIFRKVRS